MLVQRQRNQTRRGPAFFTRRWACLLGTALSVFAISLAGCSTPSVLLVDGPRDYAATDYDRVLRQWTRTEDLVTLSALDDILTVTSTFESWDFRWAYSVRYARDYQLSAAESRTLLDGALADTRAHHRFFVALYGSNRKYSDLETPQSAWTVRLVDDRGHETAPEHVTPIAKPGPVEHTYFPYASVWRKVFRIEFPVSTPSGLSIGSDANLIALRFTGPLGSEELRWRVQR
jgi:hypothetical protein